jgi:lipid II:glycine glycyltransferase (peptidoglycan interpeptide bridge formation enzyme)
VYIEKADISSLDSQEEFFQTGFWALFKKQFGWYPYPFKLVSDRITTYLLILSRNVGFGLHLGYIPMGPAFPEPQSGKEEFLLRISKALQPSLPRHICFLRYDLPWYREGKGNIPDPLSYGKSLKKAGSDIQPLHTIVLDLTQSEDELLAHMKHKTRYNIRLAEKKGVDVVEAGIERLSEWYALYRETGIRDRIALHSYRYYETLFRMAAGYGDGGPLIRLLLALVDGKTVAGIIVAIKGKTAWYMYGASSNRKRNYMPNHLLQWRAIQASKKAGCTMYDFFGIPPENDATHPLHGLYRFKTGFGGRFVNRYGCYDVLFKPLYYRGYSIAEKARTYYYKKIKKGLLFSRSVSSG